MSEENRTDRKTWAEYMVGGLGCLQRQVRIQYTISVRLTHACNIAIARLLDKS
jgi:hypothetical protein